MVSKTTVEFPASERHAPAHATQREAVAAHEHIEISLYLKPRHEAHTGHDTRAGMTARRTTLHAHDIKLIHEFAHEAGLAVVATEPARRLIRLSGPASKMEAAFHTKLHHYHDGKTTFRGRTGRLHLPSDVALVVESVLGLDTRPAARPAR